MDDLADAANRALGDVDLVIDSSGAATLNSELAGVERNLAQADTEAGQLESSLRQADRAADRIDSTSKGVAGTFSTLETRARGIGTALAAIGGVAIFGGALRGANSAIQSFAVLEDSINAVNVIFGNAGTAVLKFGEDAARSAGLSETAFNQAVVPIGALLQNFGFDADQAGDAAVILVQRAADLASVVGGDVPTALAALSSALRGEADPLEAYGASISAARVEQFALANSLAATKDQITPAITLQARYGLILQDTNKVAGDYAATAGDLANAQRTAAAEAANFGTDIGEVLAPALEVIVGLIPEVLEGLRQLVPGFAAAADSAGAFLQETSGGDDGFLREFFATLRAGAGDIGEIIPGLGDLATLIGTSIVGNVESADRAIARLDTRLARSQLRRLGTELAKDLDSGVDATKAFTTALTTLGAESDVIGVFEQGFRDFTVQTNLTLPQLQAVTREMLLNAEASGLGADEIAFLITQQNLLNEALDDSGRANATYLASMAGIPEELARISDPSKFVTFAGETEGAGNRAETALAELAAAAEAQAARTAAAFDLFAEQPQKLDDSFRAGLAALRETVQAQLDFDVNIAILRALNLDALADDFERLGVAAADQLVQAVNDIPSAIEANALLQGFGVLGEDAFNALVDKFTSLGLTPSDAKKLADSIASPAVIAAAEEAGVNVANSSTGSYQEELERDLASVIPDTGTDIGDLIEAHWAREIEASRAAESTSSTFLQGITAAITPDSVKAALNLFGIEIDLTDVGQQAGYTLITGMVGGISSGDSRDRLRDSIVDATSNALEMRSPSRIMLALGEQAGDSFWDGFELAEPTLRTPAPAFTGTINQGGVLPGAAGGVNVNINLDHASLADPVSDVARMAQIGSSIATTYRQVT